MKRFFSLFVALLCCLTLSATAETQAPETPEAQTARAVVEAVAAEDYDAAVELFSAELAATLSAQALQEAYEPLLAMIGTYQGIHSITQYSADGAEIVMVQCAYEKSGLMFTVTFTGGSVAGLFMQLVAIPEIDGLEAPIDSTTREEVALRPGAEDETIATLLIPDGEGPFPAVVMLAGSGPQDKDETSAVNAANRPFYDIAEELARQGVASIRYDKYTYAHAANMTEDEIAHLTIQEEYINDAVAAVAALRADARIGDIYLLGHSQGAMLVPRIMQAIEAQEGLGEIAGGVMLSGSPKPLWQISMAQNVALLGDEQMESYEAILSEQIQLANSLDTMTEEELITKTVFGVSAYYQKDETSVDAAQAALENGRRLFIAQGDADWQVSTADGIEAWKAALEGAQFPVEYHLYENLNHLLMTQEGSVTRTLMDYALPGHVSQQVIEDIAAFILAGE